MMLIFSTFYFVLFWFSKITYGTNPSKVTLSGFQYVSDDGSFIFSNSKGSFLSGSFSNKMMHGGGQTCQDKPDNIQMCSEWTRTGRLTISAPQEDNADGIMCRNIILSSASFDFVPEVCINLETYRWYGGAELHDQTWPTSNIQLPKQAYVPYDLYPSNIIFGNVLERYWINSKGIGIYIEEDIPLFVSFNESGSNQICLSSNFVPPYFNLRNEKPVLKIKFCKGIDIKEIHTYFLKTTFPRPVGLPDVRMFKSPIWSTWARYKVDVSQEKVLKFSEEIIHHGFSNSQIEIDDMFSTHYGEFDFTEEKFPDAEAMIKDLKSKGFRVTVWVTPFANLGSPSFQYGLEKGYWLKDVDGKVPVLVKWWHGIAAVLDVSNEDAVNWYLMRLNKMKEVYGVDSFKFDAGEVSFLPSTYMPKIPWINPGTYARKYVEAVSTMGSMIEVRCGFGTQKYPIFLRMGDKDSKWNYDNGLKTIIPVVLTLGILGYPYILPDMIGGNGYGEDPLIAYAQTVLPSKELFIRWIQVTAYLPAMQFSFVPWQYDQETIDIAEKFVKIHQDIVTPILLEASKDAIERGAPLIRPLWWMFPEDPVALETDSEFLVGDRLLVAPVLEKEARMRDIYLPPGRWEDELHDETLGPLEEGKWLRNYRVELNQVATFKRL
ncbi:hypothetical protein ACJMK2_018742 [Sinanodonta woodiana]|uniref:Uncharacterized protein n=1 Tax=Sinanodonta woodiana TaxID=1069815 RepID=A0ABD3UEC4_SINWO